MMNEFRLEVIKVIKWLANWPYNEWEVEPEL